MVIKTSAHFEKEFRKIPEEIKKQAKKKIALFLADTNHPSLRMKKIQGYHESPALMELSITMAYRVSFQIFEEFYYFRHIGTHEIF